MTSSKHNRRTFLSIATTAAGGGLLARTAYSSSASVHEENLFGGSASEYLFADGLTYLNSGTIGPCRRETIEASLTAWKGLETLPVKSYGIQGAEALAEKTRMTAAKFLGCDLSEIAITTSTTNGMNAIAQGMRLKAGDRRKSERQRASRADPQQTPLRLGIGCSLNRRTV